MRDRERRNDEIGEDRKGGEEALDDARELLQKRPRLAKEHGVGAARTHDGVARVKETEREKAFGREKARREGHGEGADVVARHDELREALREAVGVFGVAALREGHLQEGEDVCEKAENDEDEKTRGEFHAVQGAQNGAGERHVQNERAHGLGALGREDLKAAQDLPEDDEENEARDFYDRIHEGLPVGDA